MKLDTKLKTPLRNTGLVINSESDANVNHRSKGVVKRKQCINSYNGLLCLSEPFQNDLVVVCNLITGEYINLPDPTKAKKHSKKLNDCGLGYSSKIK